MRTTVFLKGCPLRCLWCCNPESQVHKPDLLWLKERCLGCSACLAACSLKALDSGPDGGKRLDPVTCSRCGVCAEHCPGEALNLVGRWQTVGEVLAEVMKDSLCFEGSGGGLTLSGGEPLAQPEFAAELLWRYKHEEKGRHAAVETCGEADWRHIQALAGDVDLFLYDIKHLDCAEHRKLTGRGNDRILENARRLAQEGHALVIRMPLLHGINDTERNLAATADFIASLPGVDHLDLLPYHRLGKGSTHAWAWAIRCRGCLR